MASKRPQLGSDIGIPLLSTVLGDEHDLTHDERLAEYQRTAKSEGHLHHMSEEERRMMESYESLDYDIVENRLFKEKQASTSTKDQNFKNFSAWFLFFVIGASTGATAFVIETCVEALAKWKFKVALDILPNGQGQDGTLSQACFAYVGISVAFACVSALLVTYLAPVAQGSGIPEVKTYLNGVNIPAVLRFPTLVAKAVGVIFSNAAGLAIGKEGPLIHSGAVWAAVYSHLPKLPKWCKRKGLKYFRTDYQKRDFVSAGAAAGVAAAFGAPMGGVLFSLEEASSFWSLSLTWRVFFCAMSSTFTLNILSSYYHGYKFLNSPSLIDFGVFGNHGYYLWEMIPFWILAVFGGFAGALFNAINIRISRYRMNVLHKVKLLKVAEVCAVMAVTALCQFWTPNLFPKDQCKLVPIEPPSSSDGVSPQHYKPYLCPNGTYNMEATLIFTTGHDGIKAFFHDAGYFSYTSLLLYGCLYFIFAVVTYGIAVPSGLFVPCILTGCAFGRIMGNFIDYLFPHAKVSVGTYALVGAVAMLGGILRMTISLTMIVLETTSDIQSLLPIMTTLMISKWVGDLFNISLYDLHIEKNMCPFVEAAPPLSMLQLQAKDVLAVDRGGRPIPVVCFQQLETVGFIVNTLKSCTHNGFPIVDPDHGDTLVGIITRAQIVVLLKKRAFFSAASVERSTPEHLEKDTPAPMDRRPRASSASRRLQVDLDATARRPLPTSVDFYDFATTWTSKIPDINTVTLTPADREMIIDFRPWMNPAPYTCSNNWPLSRVYRLFRAMGLRHLIVVDGQNKVSGIITRKEVRTDFSVDLS